MSKVDSFLRIWKNLQLVKQDSLSSNTSYTVSAVLKFKFGECVDPDTEKFELFFLVLCNQLLAVLVVTTMTAREEAGAQLRETCWMRRKCAGVRHSPGELETEEVTDGAVSQTYEWKQ